MNQIFFNKPLITKRAQTLRHNMPTPERLLWQRLRSDQLGVKFRRQHPLYPYILDFFCIELDLAIELDGITHEGVKAVDHDTKRTDFLISKGITLIRFTNTQVMKEQDAVVDEIMRWVEKLKKEKVPWIGRQSPPQ